MGQIALQEFREGLNAKSIATVSYTTEHSPCHPQGLLRVVPRNASALGLNQCLSVGLGTDPRPRD